MSGEATSADAVGIEFISVLGMAPPAFVGLADELGCRRIGIALEPIVRFERAYPHWSLRTDAALRRETRAALKEHDVTIAVGEGFIAAAGREIADMAADLDLMAELGAARVNLLSADPDRDRSHAQCAAFAEMAAARGMASVLEFLPGMPTIRDLPSALDAIRRVGRPDFALLLDTMHVFRSGSTVADVAALDPAAIGYVQLCDVPLVSRHASYADEARFDRLTPGDGELPLAALIDVLPPAVPIGLEVPMLKRAEAGVGPRERLAQAIEAAQRLLRRGTAHHQRQTS